MNEYKGWSTVSPEFGPGDTAYNQWGGEVVIDSVQVDMVVSYNSSDGNVWQSDELRAQPAPEPEPEPLVCSTCGQMALFLDTTGTGICEVCYTKRYRG